MRFISIELEKGKRFDGVLLLEQAEVEALLAFAYQEEEEPSHPGIRNVLIERRHPGTGRGRVVVSDGSSLLVLEPAGPEDEFTHSSERPSSFCVPVEELATWHVWARNIGNGLLISTHASDFQQYLTVAAADCFRGLPIVLRTFESILAVPAADFPRYELLIPAWEPLDAEHVSGPYWLDPELFAKLALVERAAHPEPMGVRLQVPKSVIKEGKRRLPSAEPQPIRFDSLLTDDCGCWAHGIIAGLARGLSLDLPRPEDRR